MNTGLDPEKVAQLLTQSSRQLNGDILSALAEGRHNALKKQSANSPVFTLTSGKWTHDLLPRSTQQWLVMGLLATILVLGASYLQHSRERQISDLDVAILTDDLPIEVFVD